MVTGLSALAIAAAVPGTVARLAPGGLGKAMRPPVLNPLFASITVLKGVGPRTRPLLARLLGRAEPRVIDLLFHLPTAVVDRRPARCLADVPFDTVATVAITVEEHDPPPRGRARAPFRVRAGDGSGDLEIVFFHLPAAQVERLLPKGARRWIAGRLDLHQGHRRMVHPDRILREEDLAQLPPAEPLYPLTDGLTVRPLQNWVAQAVARLPALAEWIDPALVAREGWPGWSGALLALHRPADPAVDLEAGPARSRLGYDELLAQQLALALVRRRERARGGRPLNGDGALRQALRKALPFALTGAQERACNDIARDLARPERMVRLLQGDVGAGKTLVATMAMLQAVEAGRQAALMAPTDLLARQHHGRIAPLMASLGIPTVLVTGKDRPAPRREAMAAVASGEAMIAIGTHALFTDDVRFADLGLAVVDEQHRFGVHQRLALADKGSGAHLLVMTATPIPRTLALAHFGDMDVSVLDEKPPGRKPIATRAVPLDRLDEVVGALRRALAQGQQAYWVCPLVETSDALDVAAAEDRAAHLRRVLGTEVALVHGRLAPAERDRAMHDFASGRAGALVATTVIEVGVDVPRATIMVIEHAERFGLAQLHQLRGRVGRGGASSSCLLLYRGPLGETARRRLEILRDTEDGFRIAEEDLKLRGEGDLLGTRQSGEAGYRLATPTIATRWLATAQKDARLALERDPALAGERGRALQHLLHLFERDDAIRLLSAG